MCKDHTPGCPLHQIPSQAFNLIGCACKPSGRCIKLIGRARATPMPRDGTHGALACSCSTQEPLCLAKSAKLDSKNIYEIILHKKVKDHFLSILNPT